VQKITTAQRNSGKPCISFYQIKAKTVKQIGKLEAREIERVVWAPSGSYCVLVNEKTGTLEFVDASLTREQNIEITSVPNPQSNLTHYSWDPTGRFFITANCQTRANNGYRLFTREGQILLNVPVEDLLQVAWRPRPVPLLSPDQIAELRRNVRDHAIGDKIVVAEKVSSGALATLQKKQKKVVLPGEGKSEKPRTLSESESKEDKPAADRTPAWKIIEKQIKKDEELAEDEDTKRRNLLRQSWNKLRLDHSKLYKEEGHSRRVIITMVSTNASDSEKIIDSEQLSDDERDWQTLQLDVEEEVWRDEEEQENDDDDGDLDFYGDEIGEDDSAGAIPGNVTAAPYPSDS